MEVGVETGGEGLGGRHRWLVADFEVGDVVFRPPIVDGSASNEDVQGRIRLSRDSGLE